MGKRKAHLLTLQEVMTLRETTDRALFSITGECCEMLNIPNGGTVAVDFRHYPKPNNHNACICFGKDPMVSAARVGCKEYLGVHGTAHVVSTRYRCVDGAGKLSRMNYCFLADVVLGLVYAAYDKDGAKLWEIDTEEYPTAIGAAASIACNGIGAPQAMRTARAVATV